MINLSNVQAISLPDLHANILLSKAKAEDESDVIIFAWFYILTWLSVVTLTGNKGITKVIMLHPLGDHEICTKFHSNPSSNSKKKRLLQFRRNLLTDNEAKIPANLKLSVSTGTLRSLFHFK